MVGPTTDQNTGNNISEGQIHPAEIQAEDPEADVEDELSDDEHGESIPLRPSSESRTSLLEGRRRRSSHDSDDADDQPRSDAIKASKRLTFLNGLGILISMQIGSGIFAAPAQVSRNVQSPGVGVSVWLLAGALAWTGANSFTELGMAIPLNGGIQEYLRECYGDFMGCVFSWTWILISKGASNAAITAISVEYICIAFAVEEGFHFGVLDARKILGIGILFGIGAVNLTGPKAGANLAVYFLVLKILTVLGMIIMGLAVWLAGKGRGVSGLNNWFARDPTTEPPPFMTQFSNYVAALFGALFTINGWESISFLVGDLENPARNLPRLLASAMVIVNSLTVLLNVCLYLVIPIKELADSHTPAVLYVSNIAGSVAAVIISVVIAVSVLGTLNANIYAVSALSSAAGKRGYFPVFGKQVGGRWTGIPVFEICFNTILACMYLLMGSFDTLVVFIGTSYYIFYFFTVVGVFILRARARRSGASPTAVTATGVATLPYRTWTWNPVVFCVCSAIVVLRSLTSNMLQAVVLGAVVLVSLLVYRFGVMRR